MPRDRDNMPLRSNERLSGEIVNKDEMNKQKVDKTYVRNANASGLGSIGRSEESNLEDNDKDEKIY